VKSCHAVPPASNQSSTTGGVEKYISYPTNVASILATSPVITYYGFWDHIPMYDTISPEMISDRIPPLSFMSYNTTGYYDIPMFYVKEVLFGQTAQGLVQGMLTNSLVNTTQDILISTTFGTSQPVLLFVVLGISVLCALTATLANWLSRQAAPMDLMRILAISRNPELDDVFGLYSDRKVKMDRDKAFLKAKVGYTWVHSLLRHALVVRLTRASKNDTDDDKVEDV
jgi:hypothetical protein